MKDSDLYDQFRRNLCSLGPVDPSTATGMWQFRCSVMSQRASNHPLDDFILWSTDMSIVGLPSNEKIAYSVLKGSPEWGTRWQPMTRKGLHGKIPSSELDNEASALSIQHVYHIKMFEDVTGKRLKDCDVVLEVGGGYGNFCRAMRVDGFRGTHIIIDLAHVREYQRLFLGLHGIPVIDKPELIDGASLLTTDHAEEIFPLIEGKIVHFVATWSLSETPIAFRNRLFPRAHCECAAYLLATQWSEAWEGIDNSIYFENFMKESGANWDKMPVPGYDKEYYLFGRRPTL